MKRGVNKFDVENSLGSLLGFDKYIYRANKHTENKNVDIMGSNTINLHCNFMSVAKDNGKDTDIRYILYS